MRKGTIVKRTYLVTNMERYNDVDFLAELDRITLEEGVTILEREINENTGCVTIKARFDSDHWDICQAVDLLSRNSISVVPASDFEIISEISPNGQIKMQIAEQTLQKIEKGEYA
tara:strand:+ start:243 stop:587 length:345 start_codon:yes stop_codon:yes gene_type:complete